MLLAFEITGLLRTMLSWTLICLILAVVAWVALSGSDRPRWLLRSFILALVVILVITELLVRS